MSVKTREELCRHAEHRDVAAIIIRIHKETPAQKQARHNIYVEKKADRENLEVMWARKLARLG